MSGQIFAKWSANEVQNTSLNMVWYGAWGLYNCKHNLIWINQHLRNWDGVENQNSDFGIQGHFQRACAQSYFSKKWKIYPNHYPGNRDGGWHKNPKKRTKIDPISTKKGILGLKLWYLKIFFKWTSWKSVAKVFSGKKDISCFKLDSSWENLDFENGLGTH